MRPLRPIFALVAVTLATTSACTLRRQHTLHGDQYLEDGASGVPLEAGVRMWQGSLGATSVDLQAMASFQQFDFYRDAFLMFGSFRGRVFPLETGPVRPFVGLGSGPYWVDKMGEPDGQSCRVRICFSRNLFDGRDGTIGVSPHATVGVEIPFAAQIGLVVDVTRVFLTNDDEWELDSWRLSAGFSFDPRR